MKVSIVTISYNQGQFLEAAIRSVLEQDYRDIEYIIVDPGSTDGSREIIERYRDRVSAVILDPDEGAADGLNRGFARASGEAYCFVNSDDLLMPNAVSEMVREFVRRPHADVVSGHCVVIDGLGRPLRKAYSDRFTLRRYAYGAAILIQPSTIFRAASFRRAGGFNVANRAAWDGELFVAMAMTGARFCLVNRIWSAYRVHSASITGSRKADAAIRRHSDAMFQRILGRTKRPADRLVAAGYRVLKYAANPASLAERLLKGPVYGSAAPDAGNG